MRFSRVFSPLVFGFYFSMLFGMNSHSFISNFCHILVTLLFVLSKQVGRQPLAPEKEDREASHFKNEDKKESNAGPFMVC